MRFISTGVGLKKSGDRLRRVQGLSKYWKVNPYTNDSVKESDNIIAMKYPLDTLVTSIGNDISLAIFLADNITDIVTNSKLTYVNKSANDIQWTSSCFDQPTIFSGRPLALSANDKWTSSCFDQPTIFSGRALALISQRYSVDVLLL